MFGAYLFVLGVPQARSRFAAVFLSAVSLGMLPLAILLCVQEWTGQFSAAGVISGIFGLGNAIGLSLQGFLMDRYRARPVVTAAGVVCVLALLGFVIAGSAGGPLLLVGCASQLVGVSVPAITTAVRSWLPAALPAESARGASYALLSALFRGAVALGPAIVSLALVLQGPEVAVLGATVLIAAATVVFGVGRMPSSGHSAAPATGADHDVGRPQGLWTVFGAAALTGLAVGVTSVAVPAVMTASGVAALAGVAMAALALGETLGSLVFGSRRWPGRSGAQLCTLQALVVLAAVVIFFAAHQPWLLIVVLFGGGLLRAPISILQSTLLDVVAAPAELARSYSALVAVGLVSHAAGNSLAGVLTDHVSADALFLVPVLVLALACVWTVARRQTLESRE